MRCSLRCRYAVMSEWSEVSQHFFYSFSPGNQRDHD